MARASAAASPAGTRIAPSHPFRISATPPALEAMTGSPAASASTTALPKGSGTVEA